MEGSISDEDVSQHQQIAQTFTPTAKYKLQSLFLWVLYVYTVLALTIVIIWVVHFTTYKYTWAHYPNSEETHSCNK